MVIIFLTGEDKTDENEFMLKTLQRVGMESLKMSVCLPLCPQPCWLQRSDEQHFIHRG